MIEQIEMKDGIKLSIVENNSQLKEQKYQGIIIITHGICEYKERYDFVKDFFIEKKFIVIRYDLRGHGMSEGKRGSTGSYIDFIEDLHTIISEQKKNHPGLNIYLIGHSMGGFIVNLYATKYSDVKGIISMGAPGIILREIRPLRILPLFLVKNFKKNNNFYKRLTSNKEFNWSQKDDPYSLKYIRFKLLKEMFVYGVKDLQKNIGNIKTPFVYFHGKNDRIVEFKSYEYLTKKNPMCKLNFAYDGLGHELFNEPGRQQEIIGAILKSIEVLK